MRRRSDENGLPLLNDTSWAIMTLSKLFSSDTAALIGVVSSSKKDLKSLPLLMNGMRDRLSNYSDNLYMIPLSYSASRSIDDVRS